jgi:cytochrome c peroxidase
VLETIPGYVREFQQVFGKDKIDIDQVTLGDRRVREDARHAELALRPVAARQGRCADAHEVAGYKLFKESGCIACHNGERLAATLPEDGLVEPYKATSPAEGRSAVTGQENDRFNFKVPTLRNVEMTYPYFHDGAANTLAEAVDVMGRLQLGKKFTT